MMDLDEPSDVPLDQCRCARPQLYFTCHLRPTGGRQPKKSNYTYIRVDLVFYSTFEPLDLPCKGQMETQGLLKFY